MKVIKAKSVYGVDVISKNNDMAWMSILNTVKEETEDVQIDFEGITAIDPWNNDIFKKLMAKTNIHFLFYCDKKMVTTINLACELMSGTKDRATNIDIEPPKVVSKEEKALRNRANMIKELIVLDGATGLLDITLKYTQLGSPDTITAMELAFIEYANETETKQFVLGTGDMFIQQNIIEAIASTIGVLMSRGLDLTLISEDRDVMQKIGLYQCVSNKKKLTTAQKIQFINDNLEPLTVGMLNKYKKSRAKDEFGRYGKGAVLYCRVAIYIGMDGTGENTVLKFDTYSGTTFFTQQHWMLEHDGDMLDNLTKERVVARVDDIGMFDSYIGSSFHFIMPIQYDKASGNHNVYTVKEDGIVVKNSLTVPEFIKTVLDDWSVKYNTVPLIHSISETQRVLNKVEPK